MGNTTTPGLLWHASGMGLLFIVLLLLILVIPQYMLQRRQRAHLQRLQALRDSLKIGDVVVTGAGMHGKVAAIAETTIDLEIQDGVVSTWEKEAIIRNITAEENAAVEAAAEDTAVEDTAVENTAVEAEELPVEEPTHPENLDSDEQRK